MSSIFSQANFFQQEEENLSCNSPQPHSENQTSLFQGNLYFQNSGNSNNSLDIDSFENNIENNLLNMIDEEPVETTPFNCNSLENKQQIEVKSEKKIFKDPISQELEKDGESSTQSSNRGNSPRAPVTESACRVPDFNKLFGEGTSAVPFVPCCQTQKENKKFKTHYDFPDGGWECCSCSNYNFKGRKRCHRCKKERSETDNLGKPQHMFLAIEEKKAIKAAKQQEKKVAKKLAQLQQLQMVQASEEGVDTSTPTEFLGVPRNGDWACVRCTNFNYSFRDSCNKCGLMQYEHYYYTNNFPSNSINWNFVTTSQNMPAPLPYQLQCQIQQQMQPQQHMNSFQNMNAFVPQQVQMQQGYVQW